MRLSPVSTAPLEGTRAPSRLPSALLLFGLTLVCALVAASPAFATPAGTVISNTASYQFEMMGAVHTGTTNTVSLTVAGNDPSLFKSQSVIAPDGSARAVKGAVITYSLVAAFSFATAAVEIEDAIPAGTRFVPGSLTLDDTPLSDATDGDAGRFDGTSVQVALGTVVTARTHTIRFQANIQ